MKLYLSKWAYGKVADPPFFILTDDKEAKQRSSYSLHLFSENDLRAVGFTRKVPVGRQVLVVKLTIR